MRILALAPHTDDVVLGAGGYLARAVEQGFGVTVLALSTGNQKTGSNKHEFETAMRTLGVQVAEVLDYQARSFPVMRQDILGEIEEQIEMTNPKVFVIPLKHDHQDHRVVYQEACRVARLRPLKIIAYEQPWNQLMYPFSPNLFVALKNRHVVAKARAACCFKSQQGKPYMKKPYLAANAARWGPYVEGDFAEAYEVIKWTI